MPTCEELAALVRQIGERHGLSWEPDCSARSILAKIDNELVLAKRRLKEDANA
jgi:hypothetical protein